MNQNIYFGLILIATGAFSSGSFAIPFGRVKGWAWESYWLIFSLGAYIIFPLAACLIFSPGFIDVFRTVPPKILWLVFLLGAVYGLVTFPLGCP